VPNRNLNRAVSIPGSGIANLPPGFGGFPSNTGQVGVNISPQGVGIGTMIDPGSVAGSQSMGEAYKRFFAGLLGQGNTSSAAAERFRNAGPSGDMALQRISSGIYNAPGGKSSGKGAGGLRGQENRARKKEQKAYNRAVKEAAMKYDPTYWVTNYGLSPEQAATAAEKYKAKYPPEFFADIMDKKNMGISSVLKDDWESFADSRGVPYNIDELMAAAGGDG